MTAESWVVAKQVEGAKDAVSRAIEQRGLPVHPMGRLRKLAVSEVDPWVRQGRAASDPAPSAHPRAAADDPRTGGIG